MRGGGMQLQPVSLDDSNGGLRPASESPAAARIHPVILTVVNSKCTSTASTAGADVATYIHPSSALAAVRLARHLRAAMPERNRGLLECEHRNIACFGICRL